jgi:zinc transport system substrate-binding protein
MRASLSIGSSGRAGRRHVAVAMVILLAGVACTAKGTSTPSDGASGAGTSGSPSVPIALHVVAAFYPLQEAAQRVGGARVDVTDLTAPGVEPHDLELTPDAIESIATADVVLYLGQGFQPAIQDAVKDAQGTAVDLLAGLPTLPPPAGAEAGVSVDPHVWLDPTLYAALVGEVAQAFATADPAHAAFYHANGDAFTRELSTLDGQFREGLRHCRSNVIVTNHAAFGYMADAYGLEQDAISGLSPDAEPSADRLATLAALVKRDGVTTIFTEDLVSPKVAQTLATEAGVATAVLHTIEGLTPDQASAGETYTSLMRENLQTLEGALGCS